MVDKYNADILRVAVAQICQTIGYNNAQTAPVELLQDVLHRYLLEFCRDLRRKTEHANRIEANLNDAFLSMKSLNIDISELLGYITNVEPVQFSFDVPKYPARKDSKLNFLKPGSQEVLTRPVHIYEYLPPLLQTTEDKLSATHPNYNGGNQEESVDGEAPSANNNNVDNAHDENAKSIKLEPSGSSIESSIVRLPNRALDDDGRPTREISSVVMTTGGFISPAIEGKLPDARIPDIIDEFHGLDAPPPPPPPPAPPQVKHVPPLVALDAAAPTKEAENMLSTNVNAATKLRQAMGNDALFAPDEKPKQRRGEHLTKLTTKQNNTAFAKQTKKAKKRLASEQQLHIGGLGVYPTNDLIAKKAQDKNQRKAMKLLQKLNKSAKNNKTEQFGDLASRLHEPAALAALPFGSNERNQLEKMLKKQAKQRQKLLKQQQQQQQKANALENTIVQHDERYFAKQQAEYAAKPFNSELSTQPLSIQTHMHETTASAFAMSTPSIANHLPNKFLDQDIEGSAPMSNNTDLKLSSDVPDRSKLNIFKKLTKPKTPKSSLSPNEFVSNANALQPPPLISLPSGTTITPAPPAALATLDVELNAAQTASGTLANMANVGGLNMYNDVAGAAMMNAVELNKPKKRGRKPGSKNQVKNTPTNALPTKKMKSSKMMNKLVGFDATMEAINLMHAQNFPGALNAFSAKPPTSDGLFKAFDAVAGAAPPPPPTAIKEKKERKKYKSKYNPLGLSASDLHGNVTTTKDAMPQTAGAPMLHTPLMGGDISTLSPTKSPNQQKKPPAPRTSPQKCSPNFVGHHAFMSPAELIKQPTMLPMLPLYPFPPRPGLIPSAPGFFPSPGMANFGNNNSAATNLLMPQFLQFPSFNPSAAGKLTNNEPPTSLSPKEALQAERNFCNVAPLIPDSMKLTPLHEQQQQQQQQPQANLGKSDSTTIADANKTDGGFTNLTPQESLNSFLLKPNKLGGSGTLPSQKPPLLATLSATATGNADDPIEVSDDSSDTPHRHADNKPEAMMQPTTNALQTFHGNLIQPGHLSNMAPIGVRDNLFMAANTFQNLAVQQQQKPKKSHKLLSNKNKSPIKPLETTVTSTPTTTPFTLDLKGKDKLSLAGGADLIPLMRTDGANTYSPLAASGGATITNAASLMSQSIAAAATTTTTFDNNAVNFAAAQRFEGVTITPTTTVNMPTSNNALDLKRRNKEHKKLKKLKEGKIKKKKDKKEKSRSKDRSDDKYLFKSGSGDKMAKDLEKKLKKEKKREKQRIMLLNSVNGPHDLTVTGAMSTINTVPMACGNNKPPASETNLEQVILNTQSSHVVEPKAVLSPNQLPKITLKIGGNSKCSTPLHFDDVVHEKTQSQAQSQPQTQPQALPPPLEQDKRSQSPELARFSPLVTRPPKTKQNEAQTVAGMTNTTTPTTINNNLNASNVTVSDMQAIASAAAAAAVGTALTSSSPNIWPSGGTLSASSVLLPQQLLQTANPKLTTSGNSSSLGATASIGASVSGHTNTKPENAQALPQAPIESNRPSSYVDADGNTIWICPACGKVDDGSPMIGCDGCDAWYHWVCVGIFVAPKDNEDWFCRVCITRKKVHGNDRKRKRNKKK